MNLVGAGAGARAVDGTFVEAAKDLVGAGALSATVDVADDSISTIDGRLARVDAEAVDVAVPASWTDNWGSATVVRRAIDPAQAGVAAAAGGRAGAVAVIADRVGNGVDDLVTIGNGAIGNGTIGNGAIGNGTIGNGTIGIWGVRGVRDWRAIFVSDRCGIGRWAQIPCTRSPEKNVKDDDETHSPS